MKKIDWYIIKKFLATFFFALLLIMSIAVIFDVSEKIEDFIDKQAPLMEIIFGYYIYFIPYFANMFSALFIFIAVVFFTSRMAYNNEIIAILSSGVSFRRLMYPYFFSALFLAIFSFALTNYFLPPANKKRLAFEEKYIRNTFVNNGRNIHKQITPGNYIYMESFSVANQTGYKFSMEHFHEGILTYKLVSEFVQWDTIVNKWRIVNYHIRRYDKLKETIESGTSLDTVLSFTPKEFEKRDNIDETMSLPQLNNYIEELDLQGDPRIEKVKAYKYQRWAFPFSTFILTLIGLSLSSRKVRGGIGLHIGVGLGISFAYILFMQLSTNIALGTGMNIILGVWLPNIFFALIAVLLYRQAPK
ncbi:MAG: LptF/LptG family permease [Bacteroidales bacterium]|nr:LptF/LptG family permease [Bacteroidales bacterium]